MTKNKGGDLRKSPNLCLLFVGKIDKSLKPFKMPNRKISVKQCNNLVSALNHCLTNNKV